MPHALHRISDGLELMFAIEKWRPFDTIEAWTRPPDLDWSRSASR